METCCVLEEIELILWFAIRMKSDVFQYAGTKDRRGRTSQWVTAKNVEPIRLLNSVRNHDRIHVGNFSYPEEVLHLGDLKVGCTNCHFPILSFLKLD